MLVLALPAVASAQSYIAPDPGGDPNPTTPVPIPPPDDKLFGMSDVFIDYALHQSPTSWARFADGVGSNVIKTSLEWWRAERFNQDEWVARRWEVWQEAYDALQAKGIRPIFILSSAPCWARPDLPDPNIVECGAWNDVEQRFENENRRVPPDPAFDAEWGEFVYEVAKRFPNAMIQVWNEPNLSSWWVDGDGEPADPTRYTELLRVAFEAVQQAEVDIDGENGPAPAPEIPVFGPAVMNAQADALSTCSCMTMAAWLAEAYAAPNPLDQYADGLSVHVFPHSNNFGANTLFAKSFEQIRQAREAAGDSRPVYILETGIAAGNEYGWANDQLTRAGKLRQLYNKLMTMDSPPARPGAPVCPPEGCLDVRGVVFHRLLEPKFHNNDPWENGLAWLRYAPPDDPTKPQEQTTTPSIPKFVYCLFNQIADSTDPASLFYKHCMDVAVGSGPNGPTSDDTPTLDFDVPSEYYVDEYLCRIDAAPFEVCSDPPTGLEPGSYTVPAPGLADGQHTFVVRAVDFAGNVGDPTSRTFTVDTVAPTASITSGPANGSVTSDTTPSFGFAANEAGSSFGCNVDNAGWRSCSGPGTSHTTAPLAQGQHTFQVRAADAAGNVSAIVSRAFTVSLPTTKIKDATINARRGKASFEFKGKGGIAPLSFECRMDRKPFTACDSPKKYRGLDSGRHKFQVRSVDADGVYDETPAVEKFRIRG